MAIVHCLLRYMRCEHAGARLHSVLHGLCLVLMHDPVTQCFGRLPRGIRASEPLPLPHSRCRHDTTRREPASIRALRSIYLSVHHPQPWLLHPWPVAANITHSTGKGLPLMNQPGVCQQHNARPMDHQLGPQQLCASLLSMAGQLAC